MKLTIELMRVPGPKDGPEEIDVQRTWVGIVEENMTAREKAMVLFLDSAFREAIARLPVVAYGKGETDEEAKLSLEIDNDIRRKNQQ